MAEQYLPVAIQHPILTAAWKGDVEGVRRLLDGDIGLLERTGEGVIGIQTPLMIAAIEGHMEVVRLLVERGARLDARDNWRTTALHHAATNGREEIVAFLLSRGAKARTRSRQGTSPLTDACFDEDCLGVVRLLLQHLRGWGVNDVDRDGTTALWRACQGGYTDLARMLLLAGADHNIADRDGTTPLQAAENEDLDRSVELLQVNCPRSGLSLLALHEPGRHISGCSGRV
jgi:ankyrin repeat protein